MSFSEAEVAESMEAPAPRETPAPSEEKAVATRPAYAAPATYVAEDDAEGEFTQRDAKFPYLNVVQKTGKLSDEFAFGDFVVMQEHRIGNHEEPIEVIPVKIKKQYQEFLPYNSGKLPQVWDKAEEVYNAGFSLEWGASKRASEILKVLFWITKPENADAIPFQIESPVGYGGLFGFIAAKTTYGTVGKSLIQAKKTFSASEKGGMVNKTWKFGATLEKKESNSWYLPNIRPLVDTPAEMQAFLRTLLQAN